MKRLAIALCLFLALGAARPALAHAILMSSVPAVDGTIAGPHVSIVLTYNSRIDHKLSRLTLTRPDGSTKVLPIAKDSAANTANTKADLAPGAYSLRWQVLAIDGHITRGDVPFTVTGK
jgi:methionine-rich copper-binding protein CopC